MPWTCEDCGVVVDFDEASADGRVFRHDFERDGCDCVFVYCVACD